MKRETVPDEWQLPLSERYVSFNVNIDKTECIAKLREMAEAHPERIITRNHFRTHSGIPERAWRHFFGTFEEFKRQARITISRPLRCLELQISKHVSADHYRRATKEVETWGNKYIRPSNCRWQTILVAGDFHDCNTDRFALRVFLDTARRAQPETVVLSGDVFDLPEFGKYVHDPREWKPAERIRLVHDKILGPLRAAVPKAQIDLIAANHEARLIKHFWDKTPGLMDIFDGFLEMKLDDLLGLPEYGINLISHADLSAWTKRHLREEVGRNYKTYHDCLLVVHETKSGLAKHIPGFSGHSHKHQSWSFESPTFGAYEWHQLGAMCIRDADYCDGEKWSVGFALAHVDTQKRRVATEYVPVGETHAVVGGKYYFRGETENVPLGAA